MVHCRPYFNGADALFFWYLLFKFLDGSLPVYFSWLNSNLIFIAGWKEAIAGDHVTLVLSSDSEAPDSPEDLSCTDSTVRSPSDMVSNATKPKSKSK